VRRDFILTGLFVDPRNGEFEFIGEFLGGEQFGGLAVCVGFFIAFSTAAWIASRIAWPRTACGLLSLN
jgi:hypothetical protein